MKEETDITLAKIQKDIEYMRQKVDSIDRKVDQAEKDGHTFVRQDFIKEQFNPLVERVAMLEKWQIRIATVSAVIGSTAGFIVPWLLGMLRF